MRTNAIQGFLGKDIEYDGKLEFQGTVRIDGHFRGEISAPKGSLIVGEEGMVEADVHASDIIVIGTVRGTIIAGQRIAIEPTGKVFGNIQSPMLVVAEEAVFEGNARTTTFLSRLSQK